MSNNAGKPSNVVSGPGLLKGRSDLSAFMDGKVQEAVAGLERAANCPDPAFDLPPGLPPMERLDRFCTALLKMFDPVICDLHDEYARFCRENRLAMADHRDLFEGRARGLAGWMAELVRVHGLAFDNGAAPPPGTVARLVRFQADLDMKLERQLRRL